MQRNESKSLEARLANLLIGDLASRHQAAKAKLHGDDYASIEIVRAAAPSDHARTIRLPRKQPTATSPVTTKFVRQPASRDDDGETFQFVRYTAPYELVDLCDHSQTLVDLHTLIDLPVVAPHPIESTVTHNLVALAQPVHVEASAPRRSRLVLVSVIAILVAALALGVGIPFLM